MRGRKLATRYARALLDSVGVEGAPAAEAFLAGLAEAIRTTPDLKDILLNPAVPSAAKRRSLTALAEQAGAPARVKSFMAVVVDHGRADHLIQIAETFREAREELEGIVPVVVEAAKPMPPDLQQRTRAALERLTGKKVRLTIDVVPDLIGGAVARVGSKVYDGSLKTQLNVLRQRMSGD